MKEFSAQELPRSPSNIDPSTFQRHLELHNQFDWLRLKSNEFFYLWNSCKNDKQRELVEDLVKNFRVARDTDLE